MVLGCAEHHSECSGVSCCAGGSAVRCHHPDLGSEKDVSICAQTSAAVRSGAAHVRHRLADVSVHATPALQHTRPGLGPVLLLWCVSFFIYGSKVTRRSHLRNNSARLCSFTKLRQIGLQRLPPLLHRCACAAPGGGGAGPPGPGSGRAEERVSGPDGDSGEAEGCEGSGPRWRWRLYSRGKINKKIFKKKKNLNINRF